MTTSSRMTASPCVTTLNRSRRPFSSIHTSLSSGLPGFMNVTAKRRARSARCCVSMVSAPSRRTAIWISACGTMYAVKRADSSVSAESRSARASNEAKNMFGRSSAPFVMGSDFCIVCPSCVTSLAALDPVTVVLMASVGPRDTASISRPSGVQSGAYRIDIRRVTRSSGGESRPVEVMVHPSSVRWTVLWASPSRVPFTNTSS